MGTSFPALEVSVFAGVQCFFFSVRFILEFVAQERFLGASGHHADLVLVVVVVLPEAVEAILVSVGLDGAYTPDDTGSEQQGRHAGTCQRERTKLMPCSPMPEAPRLASISPPSCSHNHFLH